MRTLTQSIWIAALGTLLLLPVAAADCEHGPGSIPLDYYLLKDASGDLALSNLPPSAANTTSWTTVVKSDDSFRGNASGSSVTVRLDFPAPDYLIDEEKGIQGRIRASAQRVDEGPIPFVGEVAEYFTGPQPFIEVRLVEGERSSYLGSTYLSSYPQDLAFKGSYPGHEPTGQNCYSASHYECPSPKAAPHTHGPGDDADRGLFLSDIHIAVRLFLAPGHLSSLERSEAWQFSIYIDGNSFAHLEAHAPGEPSDAPPPPPPVEEPPTNETGNETAGNETDDGDSGPEDDGNETQSGTQDAREGAEAIVRVAEEFVEDAGAATTTALGGVTAASVGLVGWARRWLRP